MSDATPKFEDAPPPEPAGPRRFAGKRKSEEIEIELDEGLRKFFLVEMTGTQRDLVVTRQIGRMNIGADGKPVGIKDGQGLQSHLISLCLYDEARKSVAERVIASWPASLQDALFKTCEEMNALNTGARAAEKKD